MLDICLLGTGGMMPLPYRWLTASGATTLKAFTTRASPLGPIIKSGDVFSAFPIVKSIPGSPEIWSACAAGADLFICEGMYGEPDKKEKAKEYKHMTFYEAAHMAS